MKNIIDVAINIINFERMKSVSVCISYSLDCGLWLDLVLFARLLVVIVVMSYRCPPNNKLSNYFHRHCNSERNRILIYCIMIRPKKTTKLFNKSC